MFKKLETIQKTPTLLSFGKCKPMFEFKEKIKDGGLTREQRLQIEAGNKYYKGKLRRQGSYYSLDKWKKDFEQSQHFKKNICEFPSIDFYKTRQNCFRKGFDDSQNIRSLLAGLDFLLAEMGKRAMKAVLYLNNSWEWSGGYGYYLEQAGMGKAPRPNEVGYEAYMRHVAQFADNERAHQLFYDYVRFIIGRQNRYTSLYYKDDPTIMAWQIGNEPRAFGDALKQPFAKWLSQASALIRQLDPNHLISVGGEGIWGCEMDSTLYAQISGDPNIDYLTAHVWPYNWSWVRPDSLLADVPKACKNTADYLRPHFNLARQLQKPLVIEEFGFPRDNFSFSPSSTTVARDQYYSYVFSLVKNEPTVSGCNFWAWGGEARPQHEQWLPGDPYMGDPAQEQQGLNSVFSSDSTTLGVVNRE